MANLAPFETIAALLAITAVFAWVNHQYLKLPNTIALLLMGLAASLVLVLVDFAFPSLALYSGAGQEVRKLDFSDTLLNGVLAFLLFAGALHVDISALRERKWVIALMATAGVFISTILVAIAVWAFGRWIEHPIAFQWALVFGALIGPTDPVAVLSTLKEAALPKQLETDMTGESLFNDGVGVVLFTILLSFAAGRDNGVSVLGVGELFVVEAGGGAVLGLALGYLAYRAMRSIDDYSIEVLISLALVTTTYALANKLGLSGPIGVVAAGILLGNRGAAYAMSETTRRYLFGFWELIDQILNSVLFLVIGLEVLVLDFDSSFIPVAAASVPIVILARWCAVAGPVLALSGFIDFVRGTIPILTWGGVRGGISIALALSLPDVQERPTILAATYTVVLFTIVVQGLSLSALSRRFTDPTRGSDT